MIFNRFVVILALFITAGCASQFPYQHSLGKGHGHFFTKVSDNLYRVHYKILNDDQVKAKRLAIAQATQLTREQHLDWFTIVHQHIIIEKPLNDDSSDVLRMECSSSHCQRSTYSSPYFRQQFDQLSPFITTEVILHIRMGRGIRPATTESYSAHKL